MRIGISTASFYPLETEKALELVAKSDCEITEIFFNADCELERNFVRGLAEIARAGNTEIKAIHPTMSLAESFLLFSNYQRRLEQGLDSYKRYGEIAAETGAKYVVMHGGKPNGVLDDEGYFERFAEIADAVRQNGGVLLQENVAKHRAGELAFLKKMKEYLKDEAAFCLDIKQSIRGGYSPFDALSALRGSIKHIHVSDNCAEDDCMLPLKGNFDFRSFFSLAGEVGFKGDAMIEVYRRSYEDYREIFDSRAKIASYA